jgi:hypothetical protein
MDKIVIKFNEGIIKTFYKGPYSVAKQALKTSKKAPGFIMTFTNPSILKGFFNLHESLNKMILSDLKIETFLF